VDAPRVTPPLALGRAGEDAALSHYRGRGYVLIARNWRCSLGEVDLVLRGDRILVFCEVKTRRGHGFSAPYDSVHPRKRRKLRLLAEAFLAAHPEVIEEVRFDVASVTREGSGQPSIHVFEDAF
jgi:putative endonuclease